MVIIFVALVGYYFVNQYFKAPEPTTMPKKTTSRSKTSYAPKKQTQRQGVYHAPRIPQFAVQTYTAVTCNKERNESRVGFSNYISSIITDVSNSTSKSIRPHCPCAWDPTGRCRQAAHMCYGPNSTYICTFVVRNATVTSLGAVLGGQTNSPEALTLRHETLCGGHAPQYEEHLVNVYTDALSYSIEMFRNEYKRIHHRVDKLIPIRTRWDDCFNHLSFQSMPLIGLVYEFHPELFYSAHWQTSRFTAAILLLLGVNAEKLIIEESALANEVWLPWMQYWNPYNTLPLPGISRGVSLLATEKLLQKKISATVIKRIDPLIPLDYKYAPLTLNTSVNSSERYVVYLNRTAQHTRNVVNELAILQAIQENLKDGYRLVVLPSMKEVRSIEEMHGRWQQFARILKHAIVIMGPHGKTNANVYCLLNTNTCLMYATSCNFVFND